MSLIKRLDDISGTTTRSKTLNEAIRKLEEAVGKKTVEEEPKEEAPKPRTRRTETKEEE